jgi:hypothetical protein
MVRISYTARAEKIRNSPCTNPKERVGSKGAFHRTATGIVKLWVVPGVGVTVIVMLVEPAPFVPLLPPQEIIATLMNKTRMPVAKGFPRRFETNKSPIANVLAHKKTVVPGRTNEALAGAETLTPISARGSVFPGCSKMR